MPDVQTPDWVKDAVFYQIFPDRFAQSPTLNKPINLEPWGAPPTPHGYQGGDLLGVLEHMDYLVDLGINALYFNPVFASGSNHRYHTFDYYQVDPHAHRGVYAFARQGSNGSAAVIFNNLREPRQASLPVGGILPDRPVTDAWRGGEAHVVNGTLSVNLAARSAAVYLAQ